MEEVKNYYAGRHLISMEEGTSLVYKYLDSLNINDMTLPIPIPIPIPIQ